MNKPPEKIKLSIIILNHDTRDLLAQCLESLPKRSGYQVIVVDDASTDGSVEMVKKNFLGVEIIESAGGLGFGASNNLARKSAKGEYVLFLNSDTKVFPKVLETMTDFMDGDASIGISTCKVVLPNSQLYYACHRGFPTPLNSLLYFLGLPSNYTGSFWGLSKIHEIDACSGTFLLIRKALLDKIGWFDQDYYAYGEDIEMCYRVKELGFKVMFNPTVKILHYWGASSGLKSTSRKVTRASGETQARWDAARYQAMKIFYDKHYRGLFEKLFRPFVFLAIDAAKYLRRGKD